MAATAVLNAIVSPLRKVRLVIANPSSTDEAICNSMLLKKIACLPQAGFVVPPRNDAFNTFRCRLNIEIFDVAFGQFAHIVSWLNLIF
jgi:hypothetical protein